MRHVFSSLGLTVAASVFLTYVDGVLKMEEEEEDISLKITAFGSVAGSFSLSPIVFS